MNDILIIIIVLGLLVVLNFLSLEKRLKSNPYLLMVTIIIALGYGGYLVGSFEELNLSRIVLIALFFIGGIWRLWQLAKLRE